MRRPFLPRCVSIVLAVCFTIPSASSAAEGRKEPITSCDVDGLTCDEDTVNSLEVSLLQTSTKLDSIQAASATHQVRPAVGKVLAGEAAAEKVAEKIGTATKVAMANAKAAKKNAAEKAASPKNPDYVMPACVFALTATAAYLVIWHLQPESQMTKFAPLVAEFVGTFVLVFTIGCCSQVGDSTWNATAIGAVLMAMIYATGPISGGHLNPAVSIALGLTQGTAWSSVFQYCAVQVFAGICASFSTCCLISTTGAPSMAVGPVAPFLWWHAGLIETFYTTMLCFVVLNCAASKRNNSSDDGNQFFGLAIGFVIIAGGYPSGGISGAHFNPAVSLGIEMVTRDSVGWGWVWACFQCAGAFIAAELFKLVRPEDEQALQNSESQLSASCVAEFLGTFVLTFTVGLNIIMGSPATAWSAAATLMSMVYSLGDVSGAHFNPAVTLAVCISGRGKCDFLRGLLYVCIQTFGGVLGGLLYAWVQLRGSRAQQAFPLDAAKVHTVLSASAGECIFTTLLAYVVLATATTVQPQSQKSRQNFYFAFCIGACVMIGGTCLGGLSGGELNPAVSIGKASSDFVHSWAKESSSLLEEQAGFVKPTRVEAWLHRAEDFSAKSPLGPPLFFCLFELLGGVAAALIFRVIHVTEYGEGSPSAVHKCLAEFVGTFYLVFTVGCCSLAGSGTWNALAIALVLTVMVYATGPVSGGNLNPAVSLCLTLCKKLEVATMLTYWFAQVSAGVLAAIAFHAFFGQGVILAPKGDFTEMHALIAEVIYTTMLCFVVMHCAASRRNNSADDANQFYGLAIGFVIIAGGYAAGSISGACFNPAVSLSLDFSNFLHTGAMFKCGLHWSIAQLLAAAVAANIFSVMRPEDFSQQSTVVMGAPSLAVKCLSEFLGVFFLVVTVGLNLVGNTGAKATALSAAGALMCMIYSLGDISGAHFNPAVTLAVVLSGRDKCLPSVGSAYALVQLLAAMFAGHIYAVFHAAGPNKAISFPLGPGKGYTSTTAGIVELFFTGVLAYTVLSTATVTAPRSQRSRQNFFFGLAIASCVIGGGFAIGKVSGGELNPAVSLGIEFANLAHGGKSSTAGSFLPFSLWQLSGGIIAALVFRFTNAQDFKNVPATFSPTSLTSGSLKPSTETPGSRVLAFPRSSLDSAARRPATTTSLSSR